MTTNRDRALSLLNDLAERMDDDAVSTLEAVQGLHDAGLLAAECKCPALDEAHAAVAEIIRLRKAISAMRDRHLARVAAADYITAELMGAQFIADDLTRILEGEA